LQLISVGNQTGDSWVRTFGQTQIRPIAKRFWKTILQRGSHSAKCDSQRKSGKGKQMGGDSPVHNLARLALHRRTRL